MKLKSIGRRSFIKGAAVTALTAAGMLRVPEGWAQLVEPNSSGTELPTLKAPPNAADCHMHIVDSRRFPLPPGGPGLLGWANATVQDYRLFQKRIGTTRVVVVTPTVYFTDNRCTVDAVRQFGSNARGIAVVRSTVTDAELKELDNRGIRGIRWTGGPKDQPIIPIDMMEPLAKRIADLGWNVQFNIRPEEIIHNENLLTRLPTPIVFDHMGRLGGSPAGIEKQAYAVIRGLIDKGKAWVTLSGPYFNSKFRPPQWHPPYPEATRIAQAYVKAAPERLLWGSDWPHPEFKPPNKKPDDAALFDLLSVWVPDEATRYRILVTNPETLYGFSKSGE